MPANGRSKDARGLVSGGVSSRLPHYPLMVIVEHMV
jgi:hypothetical protein